MEVINLFLLLGGYYIFYNLWFYQKVLLLFCSSLFTSLIINHKYIEEKSNDPDGKKFVYFVLATIINITFFMHNFIFTSQAKLIFNCSKLRTGTREQTTGCIDGDGWAQN